MSDAKRTGQPEPPSHDGRDWGPAVELPAGELVTFALVTCSWCGGHHANPGPRCPHCDGPA